MMKTKKFIQHLTVKPSNDGPEVLRLYRNIDELPFNIFLDCQCDKQLQGLIISGDPSEAELIALWEELAREFVSRFDEKAATGKLMKTIDAAIYQCKIVSAENLIAIAAILPSQDVFNCLYDYGYPLPKMDYSEESMAKLLRIFVGHYKLDRTSYSLLENEDVEKTEVGRSADRKQFIDLLTEMAIGFKTPVSTPNQIMTGQFCSMVNQYRTYIDNLKKSMDK